MGEHLGRYALERKLATGGMAEVFLARQSGPEGFEKVCVVKRMLPTLAGDPSFVRMFLDEARLAAQLNHPNIAQIFDFGEVDGTYYLAMEYVRGSNLRSIVKAHQRRNAFMAVPVAARVASQAALALDYAHNATTADGTPLGLVHRDVSPQNILLGAAGTVKLIDFGVAKATTATHHTRTGLIKGKYAYMSPEQLRAQPLDRRSDIYALGLVLYELLVSARAIQGNTDVQIMENAIRMAFDSVERRRSDLPDEICTIVRRALQKDRDSRYRSAQDMSEALERFITHQGAVVTGADLIHLLADVPETPIQARPDEPPSSPTPSSGRRMPVGAAPSSTDWPEASEPTEVEINKPAPKHVGPGQMPTRLAPAPAPPPTATTGDLPPPRVERSVERSLVTSGLRRALLQGQRRLGVVIGVAVALGVAAGFWLGGRSGDDGRPPPRVSTAPVPPPPPTSPPAPAPPPKPTTGTLQFGAAPAMDIWVDGVLRGKTPLALKLPPGTHAVVFREDRLGLTRSESVELEAGDFRRQEWRPAKGTVSIRAVPYAEVFIGERRLGLTPLDPVSLFEGQHQFRFVNKETSRSESRVVAVLPGQDTLVKVDLRPQ